MYSTLLCLLPLLSLPLGVTASMSKETRELYEAAHRRAIIARSDSASDEQSASDSHGHGHFSNSVHNSHGHGHGGPSRRNLHHGSGLERKLVRRKKDVKQKQKKRGKTCRATSTLAAPATTATATSTEAEVAGETSIAAVENAARPTTATSASSSSSAWYEYPTDSATQTAGASSSSSSSSADDWESSAVATATASATTSSAAPAESTSASGGSSGSTSNLFPWGTGSAHWTTSDGGLSFEGALKPLTAGKLPSSGSAPDGSNALVASYPAGTVGLSSAGYSFYTEGAHNGVQVDGATEVSFSYSVYLNDGFQFVKGGKMPGLYGGTSLSQAKSCSGGRQDSRDSCFSARLMWRTNGAGEIYDYLPVPYTDTDTGYGESIQRGAYSWATGKWTTVAMRLKLNDIGQSNGEQELYVDGQSVISLKDVTFATAEGTKIYGIMAQTFFGGHTDDWASPVDQNIWFKDWSLAVLA
ncbi:hypothetical protein I317_02319 [Kwoniella heveanensis CBS 569]|uniref:Polysaccharide lyase 14 domain-containing protein n=1 Tax=Kwoniella heveanensis BCC8398 TaxID=1296120 RepID=A0A1B9GVV0_9TREE|nr:hypothetical protein I316_03209 [Kwoniella heveanensis BCC8398]OCF43876.1 hypothetical protein I317_02319 [Kwoniella heveanensis CBS 569]